MDRTPCFLVGFTLLSGQSLVNAILQCVSAPGINKTSCNEALDRLAALVPGETEQIEWMVRGEGFEHSTPV